MTGLLSPSPPPPPYRQLSLREWDIPFEEVRLGDVVGRGRFGVVKKGHWHGEVAVKLLNMEDDDALEQFKRDVSRWTGPAAGQAGEGACGLCEGLGCLPSGSVRRSDGTRHPHPLKLSVDVVSQESNDSLKLFDLCRFLRFDL